MGLLRPRYANVVKVLKEIEPLVLWAVPIGASAVEDLTGNGKTGTLAGGAALTDEGLLYGGRAIALDGVNGRVTSTLEPFVNGGGLTLCGLFNRSTTTTNDCIVGSSNVNVNAIWQFIEGGNDVRWQPQLGVATATSWSGAWPGGTNWMELSFNEATDALDLLVNNVSKGTKTQTGQFNASVGKLELGIYAGANNPYIGRIGVFAAFNKILTTEQRAAIAAALA